MFAHHFKYTFKTLCKNRSLLFWTFAFPIILALFFHFAFSDIENSEKLECFDIAIVNTEEFKQNEFFQDAFLQLSDEENPERLFQAHYTTEQEAIDLLERDKIVGYFLLKNGESRVVTTTSGVEETILKYVVDEINETSKIVSNLLTVNQDPLFFENIMNHVNELLESDETYIRDVSDDHMSYMMIEFYTLIAMTCLYGGTVVMTSINQTLANMSSIGKRVHIAPIKKSKVIFSSVLASYIIELIGVTLLMLFTTLVLKVDFGDNLLFVILLSIVGTFAGLALGLFISVAVKAHENTKAGIIIAVSMAFSILSGMTGVVLKYMIDKNLPFINKVNPASMITDGFYSLYYYDTMDRYIVNIICLFCFAILLLVISFFILRRQKYDSI